jgi:hypothetical protein
MMGSPENNFVTMQGQQPRNQMLSNALRNTSNTQNYNQPSMLAPNQYGSPMPVMSNMQMPQSNASFNMQPPTPGSSNISYGQTPMQNVGYNTGLARPNLPTLGQ